MNEALSEFQSRLLLAIHGIPEEELRRPEREGKWSIAQVIAHLGQYELVVAARLRGGAHIPFDADAWMATGYHDEPLAELLSQLWYLRRLNLARAGGETASRMLRHQEKHLFQIERIKTTLGLTATDTPDVTRVVAGTVGDVHEPGPGVRVRQLWKNGVARALRVEFDPGATWPGLDYHVPGPEEVYVLSGDLHDGANHYPAGTFLHHPAGSSHTPTSKEGCALFVFYPEG